MRLTLRSLGLVVLLCSALIVRAQEPELPAPPAEPVVIDEALCISEQRMLDELEQRRLLAEATHEQIRQLLDGSLPASVSPLELLEADEEAGQGASGGAGLPATLGCETLKQSWEQKLNNLLWLEAEIARLRDQVWGGLPDVLRVELMELWQTRGRLDRAWRRLNDALDQYPDENSESIEAYARSVHEPLMDARQKVIRLLASEQVGLTDDRAERMYELWKFVVEPDVELQEPDRETLKAAPQEVRAALRDFEAAMRIEILELRGVMNETRAIVWSAATPVYRETALRMAGSEYELMRLELRSVILRLDRIVSEFASDYQLDSSNETWLARLSRGAIKTGFGLALALVLIKLAQLSRHLAVKWHSQWSDRLRARRTGLQLIRLTSGLPTVMPWVIGWVGLDMLQQFYYDRAMVLLVPLVPFARLYILYGVLTLIGQWLVSRVVLQAGSFMASDQSAEVDRRARISAAIVMLPWLIVDLINIAIGPSLIEQRVVALRELTLFLAAGMLLSLRKRDFVVALQSIMPPRIDPWVERLLHPAMFVITAPLCLLLLLPFFGMNVINRLMLDFDWYRTLYARGFRLKAGENEETEEETYRSKELLRKYREWFDADPGGDLPIVNNGLEDAVVSRMHAWLEDHGEENTLLLTGERGVGKTSALLRVQRRLAKDYPDIRLASLAVTGKVLDEQTLWRLLGEHLDVDMSAGPGALVRADAELQPTVLLLEDAHNLFLRTVDGFRAWEALMALTNTRLSNVFWLVVINNQSFAYLDNVYRNEFPLRNVLRAKQWSQNDIRSLILSRHSKSGAQLRYDEVLLASRGPEAGNVRNAEQRYFSLLWDASRGNAMMALCLWQTSLRSDGRDIVVGVPSLPRSAELESMAGPFLFVYAAMLIHENMSSSELSDTTALTESVVRAALKSGVDGGFIVRDRQRRYRIATIWYPSLRNLLTRKNMLHE